MEYLEASLELSVLWDIQGVLWEENILLRDITQGEDCLQKKKWNNFW